MNKFNVGDIVRVVDFGETYTTYTDLYQKMMEENNRLVGSIVHDFKACPEYGDVYVVVATDYHSEYNTTKIALISKDNKKGVLIGFDGIELV